MRSIMMIQVLGACLVSMAHIVDAGMSEAQEALDSYLSNNPITTRSAANSQATKSLNSLKEAVLAGNYSLSRSWEFLRAPCPESCMSVGLEASMWPVYHAVERLSKCDETMLLDFSLYTDLDGSDGRISIRTCTADLYADSRSLDNSTCEAPKHTKTVTSALQLGWDNAAAAGSVSEAVDALQQLLAYETTKSSPCNETINFAYSGQTAVGIYMGSALNRQGILPSIIEGLIERIDQEGVTENQIIQLCDIGQSARYTMGIIINSNGDLRATQQAVQTWRSSACLTALDNTSAWKNLTFSMPVVPSTQPSNSTYNWSRRSSNGIKMLPRDANATCTAIQAVANDTCTTLASECGITSTELADYNPSLVCTDIGVGAYICCTSGSAPDYAPSADADGYCYSYTVKKGDTCKTLAATYTITVEDIENYNNETWGWNGCNDLLAKENICLSSGYPPMPAVISNAVCGPQVNGTGTLPYGTNLSTLNECPLNACCDIWGQCGITADFCTITESVTGNPGTAANGTNGCISNCGTEIIQSDAPSEYFKIGYFEGFDLQRPCLRPMILDIDTSNYTHIHMSFATINSDFTVNISNIEPQMVDFSLLTDVKRIITIGGWAFSTDSSTYDIFREAVSTADNRAILIDSVYSLIDEWDLDGVDWDWEYPGEPDIPGIPADTDAHAEDFFLLLMEMAEQLPSGKTISTTAPSSFWYMKAIPIEAIGEVVDYIVMMTYDMHGQWDWNSTFADPGCPTGGCLRSHVNLTETISAMSMITKAGVSSNKVALGVANYARSFKMSEAGCYGPDCHFTGPSSGAYPGPCTDTAGYISNAELFEISDEESVYAYIDVDSNSNIMVWNDTQWAGYMDEDIRGTRKTLYEGMNFLGTAEWAIDLNSGSSLSNSSNSSSSGVTIYIAPTVWSEPTPVVTVESGDMLVMPPLPLSTNTTIIFPPWYTHMTWRSTATITSIFNDNATYTYGSMSTVTIPTVLSIPPLRTDGIPVWYQSPTSGQSVIYQTSSVRQTPFTVVMTPTVGGNTTVIGGTTRTFSGFSYTSGNYTYATPAWTGVFGGVTSVVNGTVLPTTTTTVTPHPYPTSSSTSIDPVLNTRSTKVKSGTSEGVSGPTCIPILGIEVCGGGCEPFCHWGCPVCPPGGGSGGGGSATATETGTSTSSSESSSAAATVAAIDTAYFFDHFATTDALSALQAFATSQASLISSLYASELSYLTASSTSGGATTSSTTAPTTTANPYPYTITNAVGDLVACASEIVLQVHDASPSTLCVGSATTLSTATSSTKTTSTTKTTKTTSTTTSSTAYPTPDGFGIIVFSDYECKDYIAGYTWHEDSQCHDTGTYINSYIITKESNGCESMFDSVFNNWYISTNCEEHNFIGGGCGRDGSAGKCLQNYFTDEGKAKYVISALNFNLA